MIEDSTLAPMHRAALCEPQRSVRFLPALTKVVATLVLGLVVMPAQAEIFRCTVEGKTVFTDQPCAGGKTVNLGATNTTSGPDSSNYASTSRHYSSTSWYEGAAGYRDAKRRAAASEAPMILYFRTEWCGFCRDVERNLFPKPAAVNVMKGFVKVSINPEEGDAEQALFDQYRGRGFPTFMVEPTDRMPLRISVTRAPSADNPLRNVSADTLVTRLERFLPPEPEPLLTSAADYYERALASLARGDHAPAINDTKRAIALQPRRVEYYQLLCEAQATTGNMNGCLDAWGRYIELVPADPAGFTGRSAAYLLVGDGQLAEADAQRASELTDVPAGDRAPPARGEDLPTVSVDLPPDAGAAQ